jgi:hypothetical protein
MRSERRRPPDWLRRVAPIPKAAVSILFEQHWQERRLRVMTLFAESTFDVDNTLKTWLEKAGPDKIGNVVHVTDRSKSRTDDPWHGDTP